MKKLLSVFAFTLLIASCSTDDEPTSNANPSATNDFDREAMLVHWADNIILPAYQAYAEELDVLQSAATSFTGTPNEAQLASLRAAWLDAYVAWQSVAMFEIGKAEELSLRNFTNIYPTDASAIEENVEDRNYKLDLPSKNDEQGFPALDYLLYGLADTDEALVARYTEEEQGEAYRTYLTAVVNRMVDLTSQVVNDWNSSYRGTFVQNVGSSATSSFNKLVNDYLFYYEKALRAGKIGIPAGIFSGAPLPETVEGYYAGDVSKPLFLEALNATQNFFNGKHFASDADGESLKSYLDYLNTLKDGEDLSARINQQFDEARNTAQNLNDSFAEQITIDNAAMLTTYDQLQRNVVLLKVDMFQALNVKVDFVDADGD